MGRQGRVQPLLVAVRSACTVQQRRHSSRRNSQKASDNSGLCGPEVGRKSRIVRKLHSQVRGKIKPVFTVV